MSSDDGFKRAIPPDAPSYFTTRAFRDYRKAVEEVIHAAGRALSLRQIHEALGDRMHRAWTLDALEQSRVVERIPGALFDRFRAGSPEKQKSITLDVDVGWMFNNRRRWYRDREFAARFAAQKKIWRHI